MSDSQQRGSQRGARVALTTAWVAFALAATIVLAIFAVLAGAGLGRLVVLGVGTAGLLFFNISITRRIRRAKDGGALPVGVRRSRLRIA